MLEGGGPHERRTDPLQQQRASDQPKEGSERSIGRLASHLWQKSAERPERGDGDRRARRRELGRGEPIGKVADYKVEEAEGGGPDDEEGGGACG